jgi:hypothetical protein
MNFIKTDSYEFIKRFFKDDLFFNVFVSGPKGCGKTKTIESIHKELGKQLVRVNISIETDEDSLIGGFRLRDGATVFERGPVLKAMQEGATLLLDELDQGHPQRLMCLQSILEGSPYHIKRTNELVEPKKGFKIIATANTKGSGDETGQYIGAQLLNSAMKDRFAVFYEFNYPDPEIEKNILGEIVDELHSTTSLANDVAKPTKGQLNKLVVWANEIRNNDSEFEIDESISSRKLIDIVKGYYFMGDIETSIRHCIAGYPSEYVDSFMKIYDLIDDEGNVAKEEPVAQKQYKKF